MGLFVQCFYALSLHLVAVIFGTAILHSCTFLENVLFTSLCHVFAVHHIGGCCSSALHSGSKKETRDHRQLLLCVMGWEYIARRS